MNVKNVLVTQEEGTHKMCIIKEMYDDWGTNVPFMFFSYDMIIILRMWFIF